MKSAYADLLKIGSKNKSSIQLRRSLGCTEILGLK